MLIGAHVSAAGGLSKAVERGSERGCEAIQIFNQSPRTWRPTNHTEEDFAAFREAIEESEIEAVVIHAVYLINSASEDPETRAKSLACLTHSLRVGDAIGAVGVVLHPGSAKGSTVPEAVERVGQTVTEALAESEHCPLLFEDTAGAGLTLGRNFDELAALIDASGGGDRLGVCLDSCHLLASGFDVRTAGGLTETLDELEAKVGLERLRCLHLNDSKTPLGSNRDRHENLCEGELGKEGCMAFLSEPRFEELPVVLEVPGEGGSGPRLDDVELAHKLRKEGLKKRA